MEGSFGMRSRGLSSPIKPLILTKDVPIVPDSPMRVKKDGYQKLLRSGKGVVMGEMWKDQKKR